MDNTPNGPVPVPGGPAGKGTSESGSTDRKRIVWRIWRPSDVRSSARALALLPTNHPLHAVVSRQLQACERWLQLEARLPRILRGQDKSVSAGECLVLARMCVQKKWYAAAARLSARAFATDAQLAPPIKSRRWRDVLKVLG